MSAPNGFGFSTNVTSSIDNIKPNDAGGEEWSKVSDIQEITITENPLNDSLKGMLKAASAEYIANRKKRAKVVRALKLWGLGQ